MRYKPENGKNLILKGDEKKRKNKWNYKNFWKRSMEKFEVPIRTKKELRQHQKSYQFHFWWVLINSLNKQETDQKKLWKTKEMDQKKFFPFLHKKLKAERGMIGVTNSEAVSFFWKKKQNKTKVFCFLSWLFWWYWYQWQIRIPSQNRNWKQEW